ncbi:AT hook motif family protein [Fusarium austroafricanum]|uniref:AT hook motif family protein n=1 Tax=Fusarium austroafricanum TaxID=2364996 RepID=A0A8H4K910_9HYPO|nr:AT hook motif family protein [Fusarium austroafricanum]
MNIFAGKRGGLKANYDFGIITGTMLLSTDEGILGDPDCDSHSDESEESEDEEEETTKGRKRTLTQVAKEKGKENSKPCLPPKKKTITPSISRHVFYRLYGRETGEGQVLPEAHPGQIDFLNDNCTKFFGLAYQFPYEGSNVEFGGYKISDEPKGDVEG